MSDNLLFTLGFMVVGVLLGAILAPTDPVLASDPELINNIKL